MHKQYDSCIRVSRCCDQRELGMSFPWVYRPGRPLRREAESNSDVIRWKSGECREARRLRRKALEMSYSEVKVFTKCAIHCVKYNTCFGLPCPRQYPGFMGIHVVWSVRQRRVRLLATGSAFMQAVQPNR
jgi:hypothetical protein